MLKLNKIYFKGKQSILFQIHRNSSQKPIDNLRAILNTEIESVKKAGTWKNERIITTPQATKIGVEGNEDKILNFCANNYLGLSANEQVIEASKRGLSQYGAGLSSVRFICGTQNIHKQLETKLAEFHSREDAILYPSCFDANGGLFEVMLKPEDAIFSDELNHASIIDGIRLCKAQKYKYKHRDMKELEDQLKNAKNARIKLIVTDGVFSMDGHIAPLPEICKLAKQYQAVTFIDECHATGFFGPSGRGTEDYFNMIGSIDIINSTLGKALGGASGGYTTGPKELVALLRQRSRPYLFSNTLPPPVVTTAIQVLDIISKSNDLCSQLISNTNKFRKEMKAAGFTIGGDDHPICPVMLGDAKLANVFADELLHRGIYVIGFSYPVVPVGKARIRVQISAAHTEEDINKAVSSFIEIGKKLNVIK